MTQQDHPHHRREQRTRRSAAVFWRTEAGATPHMGWLLESSPSGLAFAHRGEPPPTRETRLEILRDPANHPDFWERAIVRHSHVAHADLAVIAVEFTHPLVPPTHAVAELKIWQSTPQRTLTDLVPDTPQAPPITAA